MNDDQIRLIENDSLPYLLSVPKSKRTEENWPMLVFLHGYDEGPPAAIRTALTRHGPLHPESNPAALREFIVVAPQLSRRGDLWHGSADAVLGLVRDVQKRYDGDRQRTYLTGFSFGGNGVFDLAIAQPDTWAALWAVDPTRVPAGPLPRPVWFSFGAVARQQKEKFLQVLGLQPTGSKFVRDAVYLDEGDDHVGAATKAYRDPRIYAWLLRQRLGTNVTGD